MSKLEYANSIKFPLSILEIICIFSQAGNSKRILFGRIFYVVFLTYIVVAALMQLLAYTGDVFKIVGSLEGICAYGHHLGKVLVIIHQRKPLSLLISRLNQFWKTEKCTMIVKQQLDKYHKNNLSLQRLFFGFAVTSLFACSFSPLLGSDLPLGVWNLEGYKLFYKTTLLAQSIALPPIVIFVFAFDSIFLAFCVEIAIQFQILCECLKRIELKKASSLEDEYKKYQVELRLCVQHHVFLLNFLKKFQDFYSPALVVEYFCITPVICAEMYALLESNNLGLLTRYGIICATCLVQLAFYCLSADYATSEALTVGYAIFSSDWYANSSLRKSIPFIIQKSQKPFIFTAGGLFEFNSKAILSVLKLSWSACTVMRAVKQRS